MEINCFSSETHLILENLFGAFSAGILNHHQHELLYPSSSSSTVDVLGMHLSNYPFTGH